MQIKNFILGVAIIISMAKGFSQTSQTWNCGADTNGTVIATLSDSVLIISGSGAMKDYSFYSHAPWFSHLETIYRVIIEDSITTIGNFAFYSCSELMWVTIGNNVTTIGNNAFDSCVRLISAIIPNSVTTIGDYAFISCSDNLTLVSIPNSVTSIGERAFAYCNNLTDVYVAWTIPLTVPANTFESSGTENINLHVPCGNSLYNSTPVWQDFNIVYPFYNTNYSASMCQGGTYSDSNFPNLTAAGTYFDTLQNVNGCDSIICLTLGYYPTIPITNYSASMCQGCTYSDNNFSNLTQAGVYFDTLQNVNGCDSIVCLTLTEFITTILGRVMRQDLTFLNSGLVELYLVQNNGQYILKETVTVESGGHYAFMNVEDGDYIVRFMPDTSENALPTYYHGTEHWYEATTINITNGVSFDSVYIVIIPLSPLNGTAFISGYVEEGNGKRSILQKSTENRVQDVNVYLQSLQSSSWTTIARTLTNVEGYFEFKNVPAGTLRLILDVPGLEMNNSQSIEVNEGDTIQELVYEITENGINNPTNINSSVKEETNIRIYPNPTNGILYVDCAETEYQIFNLIGQPVMHGKLRGENSPINVSHLAKGVYYIKVLDKIMKFVKM